MDDKSLILACSNCATKNRIPVSRIDEGPKCAKCGTLLPVENLSRPVDVTDSTFNQEVLGSALPVLVDCWAPWCMPCRAQQPILEKVADELKGRALIASLNTEENRDAAYRLNIHSIPTLLIFRDGEERRRFIGLQKADSLTKALEDALVAV